MCESVCACMTIASPLLDPTSYITRGTVLVAPGDSQSVLALQYKEIIVIFKKLPLRLGTVFLQGPCVGQLNLNTCLCVREFWMHVNCHCNPLYFQIETDVSEKRTDESIGHLLGSKSVWALLFLQ